MIKIPPDKASTLKIMLHTMEQYTKQLGAVAQQWDDAFKKRGGYEHHTAEYRIYKKLKNFSRIWRRIFRAIGLDPYNRNDLNVFELGCGGGQQLIQFAVNQWRCTGIDCSKDVLQRAKNYFDETRSFVSFPPVSLICDDFLNYQPSSEKFDIVFHVGVLEHFLDAHERIIVLQKMFNLTKPGGYVISIVPSGMHPLRTQVKKNGWCGYLIPEIDYTAQLMRDELQTCSGVNIQIIPHNIFGYILVDGLPFLTIKKIIYYFFQLIPPIYLPYHFRLKHAHALIGIAQKSLSSQ
ncbi:MAG: class I SAM-dependent methyltransferase [Parcubacteria group bacterium]|nr:class I SAM-dependent methyltransferase [Parcubacteria group bacterium]